MVEEYKLKSTSREGKRVVDLRKNGKIPAVVYGSDFKNRIISVDSPIFKRVFDQAGESSLINLSIDDSSPEKVLVHEVQIDPVTSEIIHIDFYKVNMKEKIKTEIPLKLVGESLAVVDLEGTLVSNKDSVAVECLPSDLVHEIEVDISVLKTFDDVIKISDIKAPARIEILDDLEEVAILVQPPRSEEELAELEEKPEEDVEAVEVEGEKPEEGEEVEGEEEVSEEEKAKSEEPVVETAENQQSEKAKE